MDLSNKVKQRREKLGWSQDELAKRMGYSSRTSINKIENGRPCSQKIIARLADALGTSVSYLMGWDTEPEEKNKPSEYEGLTENQIKLIEYAKSVPEDRADMVLRVIRSIVEND